jgi:hypothetical protein
MTKLKHSDEGILILRQERFVACGGATGKERDASQVKNTPPEG